VRIANPINDVPRIAKIRELKKKISEGIARTILFFKFLGLYGEGMK
jgi:hypothetical protein